MKLVIDENRIVRSIWSGNSGGIKKKAEYEIIEAPSDWAGEIGDSIDEFEEDWSPSDNYLKRVHEKERKENSKRPLERRQRRAVAELKRLFEKECRIWSRLDADDDPRAKEKCEKWLRRIEREINITYDTDFHINLDEPIEKQLNLDVDSEVFAKNSEGYWELRRLKNDERVDGESIVKRGSLTEDEERHYEDAVSRDGEAIRLKNMSQAKKKEEKERELDNLADRIALEERKAQIRGKEYDSKSEFEKRSKEIEKKYE